MLSPRRTAITCCWISRFASFQNCLELLARDDLLHLVLHEPLHRRRDRTGEERQLRRLLGQDRRELPLHVERLEDRGGDLAGERLLHGRIVGERRDDRQVRVGVGDRTSCPRPGQGQGEARDRDHDGHHGGDAAQSVPLHAVHALDLRLESVALLAELFDVLRVVACRHGYPSALRSSKANTISPIPRNSAMNPTQIKISVARAG